MVFAEENFDEIRRYEEGILAKYKSALAPYERKFRKYGAEVRVYLSSGSYKNAYMDFVSCEVCDSNGKIIESKDGDLTMDFAWPIALYKNVMVYIEDGVSDELQDDMECCADYFKNPY